jgi:hypothetical protein
MSVAWQCVKDAHRTAYGSSAHLPGWLCTESVQHPAALTDRVSLWETRGYRQLGRTESIHYFEECEIFAEVCCP